MDFCIQLDVRNVDLDHLVNHIVNHKSGIFLDKKFELQEAIFSYFMHGKWNEKRPVKEDTFEIMGD